ncbi:glycosyltransferase [Flaviramulus sp. BrNp1-15]|uniref:glycosyltransferase n=1 Tax=Flaviramulus sp. BrNp1-15 TaxID=2916754 RepID=UPI001EE914BC|nr:glycosyltransferase [Flaviramulus sp. BrNp1-15]ULC58273.1 glycosyltransferase [Flaviramulus sp. BrNp1-15]
MKKILLLMPYGSVGGMERLALSFYHHYISKGYKVKALKFIKLETDIINFGDDELYLKNIDFYEMSKLERLKFYFQAPKLIRTIIKKEKISHSIAFGDMANLFSSLTFTKEFKIASIHALKSVEFSNKSLFNSIFKLSYKSSYKYIDKVVCISKDIKQDLIDKCGFRFKNKLEIIYNPHNLDEINRLSRLPIEDLNEQKLFSGKIILFLGRLSIQKSPWHLLKAFSLVLKECPDVKLVFIGDGDTNVENFMKNLINHLKINENTYFLGRKNNPYNYLAKAKVLALSSHYEGTPNVIVESMCVNTPIVSSFCTKGITELMGLSEYSEVTDNVEMEAGIVTPNLFDGVLGVPESIEFVDEEKKLANALISVINSEKYKSILEKNKNSLLSKFNIEKVAKNYLEKNI